MPTVFKLSAVVRVLAALMLLFVLSTAEEAAAQPVPQRAYVANSRSDTVSVIDRTTDAVVGTIVVGPFPVSIAVTPDGVRAYVANSGTNTVSVIDTASSTVVATVQVGMSPVSITITPDGKHAYVANTHDRSVSVIDTATQTVVATVPVGAFPNRIAMTPDGGSAWVTNEGDHSVSIIATATNTVTATVFVGNHPFDIVAPRPPPAPPSCIDGIKNGQETDVDCGGPTCPKCAAGEQCQTNADCVSNKCVDPMGGIGGPGTCSL